MRPLTAGFQGAVWSPPPFATVGFALFAALFDKVAIVCYKDTCADQVTAFPANVQPKVVLIDSDKVNKDLGIGEVDDHGYKVTQGHAAAWNLLSSKSVNSVLVLEDDYRMINGTVDLFADGASNLPSAELTALGKLVSSSDWGIMRFGYNALHQLDDLTKCSAACDCVPTAQTPNVCSVTLPLSVKAKHCDIRCTPPRHCAPMEAAACAF